ncbi:hypothetical protein [Mesorhizobium comanense]|uniref:hypothetical protein n=1 Tax=Mesorhizobium comanense TaxID=2502215 RepID=UPI0010F553E6|nr:hypothetical protein [Mesorhizobium comanense]
MAGRTFVPPGWADKHLQMRPTGSAGTTDDLQPATPLATASSTGMTSSGTQLITASRQRQLQFVLQNGFFKTTLHYSSDNCLFDN